MSVLGGDFFSEWQSFALRPQFPLTVHILIVILLQHYKSPITYKMRNTHNTLSRPQIKLIIIVSRGPIKQKTKQNQRQKK